MKTENADWNLVLEFLCEGDEILNGDLFDPIFVCGNHQASLPAHVLNLYHRLDGSFLQHLRPVVVSGGINERSRPFVPAEFATEADYYGHLLKVGGVSPNSLILERCATNTLQNVCLGRDLLKRFFESHPRLVSEMIIVCAIPPLLCRALATFRKQWPEIQAIGSTYELPDGWLTPKRRRRVLGEFERLESYAQKGHIAPVKVPSKVQEAAKRLERDA